MITILGLKSEKFTFTKQLFNYKKNNVENACVWAAQM